MILSKRNGGDGAGQGKGRFTSVRLYYQLTKPNPIYILNTDCTARVNGNEHSISCPILNDIGVLQGPYIFLRRAKRIVTAGFPTMDSRGVSGVFVHTEK